jgi:hypothetical protein
MIRKLLQSALCVILCPLLAAQQISTPPAISDAQPQPQPSPATAYLTLSRGTEFDLLAPGPVTFAKARPGVVVQFVVDKDVLLGGVLVIHAGIPVAGVVDSVKRGSHFRHRTGEMEVLVTKMVSGSPLELHLRCFESDDQSAMVYSQDEPDVGLDSVEYGAERGVRQGLKWGPFIVLGVVVLAFLGKHR